MFLVVLKNQIYDKEAQQWAFAHDVLTPLIHILA